MTRNLPEPSPDKGNGNDSRRWAHAALDELLNRADLHKATGKGIITIDFNQGGPRAIRFGIEEIFKI